MDNDKIVEALREQQKQLQDVTKALKDIHSAMKRQESRWSALWRALRQFMSLAKPSNSDEEADESTRRLS